MKVPVIKKGGKTFRRFFISVIAFLVLWILLAQFFLFKNRMADHTVAFLFEKRNIEIRIFDTTINNRKLHYAVTGQDSLPTLVFIHGSPGSWSNYRKFMWDDSLQKKFRMVSIDRPGFGYSDFGKVLHVGDQADLLKGILLGLQNGKPVILCGHSMGAPVAIQIAANSPGLVDKLVLVGAPLDVTLEKKERWRYLMNNKPLYYLLPGAYGPSNTELLYLKRDLVKLQEQYKEIRCDVEFIHGDEDDWVPIENITLGLKTMINARSLTVDTIKGAGHLIPWKNEALFRQRLREITF